MELLNKVKLDNGHGFDFHRFRTLYKTKYIKSEIDKELNENRMRKEMARKEQEREERQKKKEMLKRNQGRNRAALKELEELERTEEELA